MAALDDVALCREIRLGNASAFTILAGKYKKRLFSLGYSFFKNSDDSEDFIQDVLVKVYVALDSFRGESLFSTWLMRIAYNTAINSLKKKREYTSIGEDFDILDTTDNPEEQHLRNCSRNAINDAIKTLPERYRICVDLYFYYDMPYGDISEVTGEPVNTIKSHVFRAKKILKKYLSEGDEK